MSGTTLNLADIQPGFKKLANVGIPEGVKATDTGLRLVGETDSLKVQFNHFPGSLFRQTRKQYTTFRNPDKIS